MTAAERLYTDHISSDGRNEVNVRALIRTAWRHKYVVAITTVVVTLLALYLALTATPLFRGQVVITQVRESEMGGLGASLSNEFGGLASLAGINLGGAGQQHEYEGVLESRHLVEEFIKRNDVLAQMTHGQPNPMHLWRAVEIFRAQSLNITEDKLKGLITVTVDWTDPVTAARWANAFVALANELIRAKAINDASRNIGYLNKQIAQTNVLEVQRVMYNLIESQTKTLMLANGRTDYAFTVVDPAVTPEKRFSPRRTLMVGSGFVIGLILGALIAIGYDSWTRSEDEVPRRSSGAQLPA